MQCLRYSELYEWLSPGAMVNCEAPVKWQMMWDACSPHRFCESFETIGRVG